VGGTVPDVVGARKKTALAERPALSFALHAQNTAEGAFCDWSLEACAPAGSHTGIEETHDRPERRDRGGAAGAHGRHPQGLRPGHLHGVDLDAVSGDVPVLAGENGAGKSTLINILSGVHSDYLGSVTLSGRAVRPASPQEANALGIVAIYQELSLVPSMTVADSIFVGRAHTVAGMIDDRKQREHARKVASDLGLDVDVEQRVKTLSIGTQQMLEIAKTLSLEAKVRVQDEQTADSEGRRCLRCSGRTANGRLAPSISYERRGSRTMATR